jgi:hypothetical protein
MPAWQAIVEVKADGFEKPLALGESAVFEFAKAKFDDHKFSIRKNMFVDIETIGSNSWSYPAEKRVALNASKEERDLDVYRAGLHQTSSYAIHSPDDPAAQRPAAPAESHENQPISSGKARRFREGAKRKPREHSEAKMNNAIADLTAASVPRARRGRPTKAKSEAVLTRRLQIMVTPEDIERIQFVQDQTSADSMGEVIRDAVRAEYERLVLKRNQKRR